MSKQKTAHPGERIAKVMARAGLCSRRDAESWIEAGRVSVNGKKLTSAAVNVEATDMVLVDGKPLPDKERQRVWLYYKPKGLMTTARDPEGRPTVFERLPPEMPRVISVGRLDLNSEGLLLLTNDGELARRLELPSTAWVRRYRVRINGRIDPKMLEPLKAGITIEGVSYGPIEAAMDRQQGANAWITMGLTEGKNREIRRICQHFGWPVSRLIRIAYGPFQLGEMEPGQVTEVKGRLLQDQLKFGNDWNAELSRAMPAVPAHIEREERQARDDRKTPRVHKKPDGGRQYPEARKRWGDKRQSDSSKPEERERKSARPGREKPGRDKPDRGKLEGNTSRRLDRSGKPDKPKKFDDEARKLAARIDGTLKLGRIVDGGETERPAKPKRQGPRNAGKQKPKRDANRFR